MFTMIFLENSLIHYVETEDLNRSAKKKAGENQGIPQEQFNSLFLKHLSQIQ